MALTREQLDAIKSRFPRSRRSVIARLHTQSNEDRKCATCGYPAEIGERHCSSCLQQIDEIDYASEVGYLP